MTQLALDLLQPLQPSLENFVVGRNAEALAALRALAAGALAERSIYLWGPQGSGRTHLVAALARRPGAYRWSPDSPAELPGLALADDVDRLDTDAQIALFNRLNAVRAQGECACVATGPVSPAQLDLREDLRSRLAWGYVYTLQPLSDEEKTAALREQAASRGVKVEAEVFPFLLTHLARDMRTLVAALDALDAWALERKRAVTLSLAREWLAAARAPGSPAGQP